MVYIYIYHHFSSDSHTLDGISIMPIEVVLEPSDVISLPSIVRGYRGRSIGIGSYVLYILMA